MLQLFKSLADQTRLQILSVLQHGEFSVREITSVMRMGQSRISRHLKILTDAGVTTSRREGAWVFYRLADESPHDPQAQVVAALQQWSRLQPPGNGFETRIERVLAERRDRSRDFFSRVGARWDAMRSTYLDNGLYFAELARLVGRPARLADVGCGTGETIARLAGSVRSVIGVDNSPEMLQAAHENLSELPLGLDLRLGNLEHLPIENGEVDRVLAALVLHHVAQPAAVFGEFLRILQPGGRLVLVDFQPHGEERLREEMADLWLGFPGHEIQRWMMETGFEGIQLTTISGGRGGLELFAACGTKP
jgi:ubiquinone/menaquinone biosynthesis C-methylase UbiE